MDFGGSGDLGVLPFWEAGLLSHMPPPASPSCLPLPHLSSCLCLPAMPPVSHTHTLLSMVNSCHLTCILHYLSLFLSLHSVLLPCLLGRKTGRKCGTACSSSYGYVCREKQGQEKKGQALMVLCSPTFPTPSLAGKP